MYSTLIDAASLQENLDAADWVIVDSRYALADKTAGYRAYLDAHIPGAVYADLETDLSAPPGAAGRHPLPDASRMTAVFSGLGIGTGTQVVIYDDAGGSIAARLWWMLHFLGHEAAAVLDGGWQAWAAHGGPVENGARRNTPAVFRGTPRQDRLLSAEEVPAAAALIDARAPQRYRGEHEPIDPVAGHIPGALNYHWQRNLDAQGRFRPAAELRQEWLALLAGRPAGAAACYCGSGVTACHNLLAAARAGLPLPRLYAGSWSEWCRDPARPVVTGAQP